jgi:hypothetical protein
MKEELFESILSEADKSYKAKVGGKWLKGNSFTDKEKNADTFESKTEPTQRINQMKKDGKVSKNAKVSTKEIFESILNESNGTGELVIKAGLAIIMIAAAFGIRSCKDNEADKCLKELGSYENYMKYNMDGQGSLDYAVGIGDTQSKAMYACVVALAREKGISIDEAARQATSTLGERYSKEVKGAFTNGFKGRITGVSVGKDVNTGERIVRVDSEWQESHTSGSGEHRHTYTTTEHGTVYIPMSEGNIYGIDDNGKSVNIGGSTFVFDEAKKELFDNVLREAGRRISSYSDIELALEFIGQYCAVFDVGKMGYSSNPRASKLAEACSERFGDKWDNDYYGNGPSMEKLLVNKFDEMNKANDCGNSIGAIYKAANMTWGPYKDWVRENWKDIIGLSPKFAKYYDNTNFF